MTRRNPVSSLAAKVLSVACSVFICANSVAPASGAPAKSGNPPLKLIPPPEARPIVDTNPQPAQAPAVIPSESASTESTSVPSGGHSTNGADYGGPEPPHILKSTITAPYLLGPGDELTITDPSMGTDEEPYETDVKIAPDGTISVPPLGAVQAEGLTIEELNNVLNEKEKKYVDGPMITATLKKERVVYVHVLGEVVNPGLYSDKVTAIPEQKFDVGIAVTLSASERPPNVPGLTVLTAIQVAGGVKDTADIRHIKLIKPGDPEQKNVDLWRLLVEGDQTLDFELRSGDTIYVPKGGSPFDARALGWSVRKPRPVRIIGEVNRPGLYYLGPDDDLITILAKAGGFDSIAKQRHVLLSRQNHDGTVTTRAVNVRAALRNHDRAGRLAVMPGDVIMVDASIIRRVTPLIAYMAAIAGSYTLIHVISAALPVTFMHNLTRGQNGNGQSGGYALFGISAGLGNLFGYGVRQQSSASVIP